MGMNLSELWELVMDREAWRAVICGVQKSRNQLSDWAEHYIVNQLNFNLKKYFKEEKIKEIKLKYSLKKLKMRVAKNKVLAKRA